MNTDYPKLEAKTKDYTSEKLQTMPLQMFDHTYWNEILDMFRVDRLRPFGDHRKLCQEIWDKPSFYFQSEFRFHCYLLDLGAAQLLILTAAGKGTAYEVVTHRDGTKIRKDKETIHNFFDWWKTKIPMIPQFSP